LIGRLGDGAPPGPLAPLAALTFARVAYGVQFQSAGAVGPAMVADLGLAYASLGTLVGAYSALGLALSLPAGWMIARLGERRVVLAGLGLMAMGGLLLAVAPGFGAALAGRLVSGAGAMLLIVALPAIVAGRFAGAALPAAMGTLLAGYPLGIGLGFVALPLAGSWRAAMAATAALALLALAAAAATLARSSGEATGTRRGFRLPAREMAPVIAAGLVWGCPNAGFATLLGFAPAFFVGQGMPGQAAGALVSLVAFATVPTGPLGGWLVGRLPRPLRGIAAGIALTAAAMALLAQGVAPTVLLVTAGVAARHGRGPDRGAAGGGAGAGAPRGGDGPVLAGLLRPDAAAAAPRRAGARPDRRRRGAAGCGGGVRRAGAARARRLCRPAPVGDHGAGCAGCVVARGGWSTALSRTR
jgi:predicted MFS family arabinose efflux permease